MTHRHFTVAPWAAIAVALTCASAYGQFDRGWILRAFDAAPPIAGARLSPALQTSVTQNLPFVGILRSGAIVLDAAPPLGPGGVNPGVGRAVPEPGFMEFIDELIVHHSNDPATFDEVAAFDQWREVTPIRRDDAGGFVIVRVEPLPNARPGFTPSLLTALSTDNRFDFIEANVLYRGMGGETEPLYPTQWGLSCINAPTAWSGGLTTGTVTVAIIDSGIDDGDAMSADRHLDLREPVAHRDYLSTAPPLAADLNGHGTFIAGVIGANGSNDAGMSGVCWSVPVINIRALDAASVGTCGDVASAIRYAVDQGARIINASWGGTTPCAALEEAIAFAGRKGCLVVAAAGNDGVDMDAPGAARIYPACYANPNIVSVLAIDDFGNGTARDDAPWGRSNRGAVAVDLGAPGVLILGTKPRNQFVAASGTSAATAFVSGALALIWGHSASSGTNAAQAKQALLDHVRLEPAMVGTCTSQGILDLSAFPIGSVEPREVVREGILRVSGTGRRRTAHLEALRVTYELRFPDTVSSAVGHEAMLTRLDGMRVRVRGTPEPSPLGPRESRVLRVSNIEER